MSPALHTRMVGCEHAFEIWNNLEVFFVMTTRAKVSHLKQQLKSIKKVRNINDYLISIKKVVDTLGAIGSPIDDNEYIQVILDVLPANMNQLSLQ